MMLYKQIHDPFYPSDERDVIASSLITSWNRQMGKAIGSVMSLANSAGAPDSSVIDKLDNIFHANLSGKALNASIESKLSRANEDVFLRAGRESEAEKASGGRTVRTKKDGDMIIVIDDISEEDAIKILADQLTITSGHFYDRELSQSLKDEMLRWFEGELTRDELVEKMKKLTNERLTGEKILSTSYFERLANLHVQKVRNIAKYSRGKALGGSEYGLVNPMDNRTSSVCRAIVGRNERYPLSSLDNVVKKVLAAETVEEQIEANPFWKTPDEDRAKLPPFHYGDCRTTIRIYYL